ncbi:MAG: hypothetical protein KF784_11215 [Fimbriimonadaceae bacterium]|nr:hypothetical protein [Fimbriimonadaceae bacterium]
MSSLKSSFTLVLLVLGLVGTAHAQSVDQVDQTPLPNTIRPSELPPDYKAVRIQLSGGSNNNQMMQMMSLQMMSSELASFSNRGYGLLSLLFDDVYWYPPPPRAYATPGYVYAYKLEFDYLSGRDLTTKPGPDSFVLRLCTISSEFRMVTSELPELTKERLLELLGGSGSAGEASMQVQSAQADLSGKRTATLSNIKQVGTAMMIYMADYDDVFPYAQSTTAAQYVTNPYMKNTSLWTTLNPNGGRILFNTSLGGVSHVVLEDPSKTVMFYESNAWPDGRRCVCFADTSSRFVDQSGWKELAKTLKLKLKRQGKPLPANYGVEWAKKNGLLPGPPK